MMTQAQAAVIDKPLEKTYPVSYQEKMIKGRLYRITSVYKGEKELGETLEKLAVKHILDEIDGRAKELLRA